jgi:hypothetical protein
MYVNDTSPLFFHSSNTSLVWHRSRFTLTQERTPFNAHNGQRR